MTNLSVVDAFSTFLANSPTAYHATASLASLLESRHFERIAEDAVWDLQPGKKYYVVRSDASLVAFIVGTKDVTQSGVRFVGAHTDSPCLKAKPQPEKNSKGYQQIGVEVYGGALLNPWFDRDLSFAGKVVYVDGDGTIGSALVDLKRAVAVIPSLAIHLDREANQKRTVNPQSDMNVVLFQGGEDYSFRDTLLSQLHDQGLTDAQEVLDFDISFYDTQSPAQVGMNTDFFAGARLDNLLSSYIAVLALSEASTEHTSVAVCNDHEEVGSQSDSGAMGSLLEDVIVRLIPDAQARQVTLRRSLLISADNAHGVHPNYSHKHDDNHGPLLNAGPVIKFDAKQSYATSAGTAAFVRSLARAEPEIPLQSFVTRADMRCGSTIGPITASGVGVQTVDIGVPTFAMHSIRELAGCADIQYLKVLLDRFFAAETIDIV